MENMHKKIWIMGTVSLRDLSEKCLGNFRLRPLEELALSCVKVIFIVLEASG
jgi:hypothetical protein